MSDKKPIPIGSTPQPGNDTPQPGTDSTGQPPAMSPIPAGTMIPVCPYCSADPMDITCLQITAPNGAVQAIIYCANPDCRKVLNVQLLAMPQQAPPRIARPGGW